MNKENLKNLTKLHRIVEASDSARRAARAEETEESASHHESGPRSQRTYEDIIIFLMGELGEDGRNSKDRDLPLQGNIIFYK